jgi:hypothetical protein
MSKQITHSYIRDPSLHHQTFHYQQATDPGAVGAGVWWLNTTVVEIPPAGSAVFGLQLSYRNDADDGWVTL